MLYGWVLVFSVLSGCFGAVAVGAAAPTAQTGFVVETVGSRMCPPDTTPDLYSYTRYDVIENRDSTAYELICVDAAGETRVNLGPTWAFIWAAILGGVGLLLAAILSALVAAPAGAWIGRRFGKG